MQELELKKTLEEEYFNLKVEYEKCEDSITLKRFKILDAAFKIGKKVYGTRFSLYRLAWDFEIPYTTIKRILSLRKANVNTWNLIKEGKISAAKAAFTLASKSTTYQDFIFEMIIKNNLSYPGIKKMKVNEYKDMKKTRTQIAVDKGFCRDRQATASLLSSVRRLDILLALEEKHILPSRKALVIRNLKILSVKINEFIKELE